MASKRDVLKVLARHRDRAFEELGYKNGWGYNHCSPDPHPLQVAVFKEYDKRARLLFKQIAEENDLRVTNLSRLTMDRRYSSPDLHIGGKSLESIQREALEKETEARQAKVKAIKAAYEQAEEQILLKGVKADLTDIFEGFVAALEEITGQ